MNCGIMCAVFVVHNGFLIMSQLVNLEQLKIATGYDRPGDVEKCLKKNGVRFLYGKSGIYTTMDALNAAMGLKSGNLPDLENNKTDVDII
jgi:hypothetical protein